MGCLMRCSGQACAQMRCNEAARSLKREARRAMFATST